MAYSCLWTSTGRFPRNPLQPVLIQRREVKAIFWDNDGVLVDTEDIYFRATQEVLASIDII